MVKNAVDVENGIVEMKKVGTVLKALSNQDAGFYNPEDSQRAIQTVQELFDTKLENLENAFYGDESGQEDK